jgi:hypothetical protein
MLLPKTTFKGCYMKKYVECNSRLICKRDKTKIESKNIK